MTFFKPLYSFKSVLFYTLLSGTITYAQSENVESLLETRQHNINHQISLKTVDKELYQLGYRPKAIVKDLTDGTNQKKVEFSYFNQIVEQKKQRLIDRLKSTYSFISEMYIDTSNETITLIFSSSYSENQLDDIVLHFGYNGHEIH